jgi:hypothetical protein
MPSVTEVRAKDPAGGLKFPLARTQMICSNLLAFEWLLSTTNFSEKPTSHISSLRAAAGWASSCCHADTRHRSSNAFITRAVVAHELPHGTKFGAAGTTIVAANSDEGDPTCDLHTKLEGHIPHPSPATGHEIDTYAVHECPK